MAVRYFDGAIGEAVAVSGGAIGALCNGAYSVVVIAKTVVPNGGNQNRGFLGIQVAATNMLGSLCTYNAANPSGLRVFTDSDESDHGVVNLDDSWQIIGYSKASGTTVVRFHRKELGAGSWTHQTADGTIPNNASSVTRVEFGRFMGGAFSSSIDAHLAVAAVFPTELSDASFESIQTTPSTQTLLDLGAVGLWDFNQASTATDVEDLTGGGADQTAITGTTVIDGDDPPGWTFLVEETFPTTGLLDDFNRTDETPLSQGGAWDCPVRAGTRSQLRVVSNTAARHTSGSTSEGYRVGTSFTESEAYFTVSALPNTTDFALVLARIQSVESTNADFYAMEIDRIGANNYSFTAYRVDDAAFVELAVVATGVDLQVGDKFGMEVTGTGATVTLRCLMDAGSGWAQVGSSVTDTSGSRITSPGPIGLSIGGTTGGTWRLDDFGGGEVADFPSGSLPWFRAL